MLDAVGRFVDQVFRGVVATPDDAPGLALAVRESVGHRMGDLGLQARGFVAETHRPGVQRFAEYSVFPAVLLNHLFLYLDLFNQNILFHTVYNSFRHGIGVRWPAPSLCNGSAESVDPVFVKKRRGASPYEESCSAAVRETPQSATRWSGIPI